MCKHIISKGNRQCKNKTEPYCYLHADLYTTKDSSTTVSTIPVVQPKVVSIKKIECPICTDMCTDIWNLSCCKQTICRDCIINAGTALCPFCRADIRSTLTPSMIRTIDIIASKDKQIKKLSDEVQSLRTVSRLNSSNVSEALSRMLATIQSR